MLTIDTPGGQTLQLSHLVLDFNGTIGNGRNDRLMLHKAALGIGLLGSEGACTRPSLLPI